MLTKRPGHPPGLLIVHPTTAPHQNRKGEHRTSACFAWREILDDARPYWCSSFVCCPALYFPLSLGLNTSDTIRPKNTAAHSPAAAAEKPPVNTPSRPFSATA